MEIKRGASTIGTLERQAVVPTQEEIEFAKRTALPSLAAIENSDKPVCMLTDGQTSFEVPVTVYHLLVDVLHAMAEGKGIMLVPVDAELSTQEAADMLNVSRPYFVKLLDEGKIPYRAVGRYRRVRYDDLLKYQQQIDARRNAAMDALAAQAQDLGMGY